MGSFIHPSAIVESSVSIGNGTKIWAFSHVLPDVQIGDDCNICDHVFIETGVRIGDRVTVKCGVQLWTGLLVGDDVFIGPNVAFTNDRFPRSKRHLSDYPRTVLEPGCSIGANATILPGVRIGRNAMIGAGTVVTNSVPANAIVVGNPGAVIGYVGASEEGRADDEAKREVGEVDVGGAKLIKLPVIEDLRGDLSVAEVGKHLPFTPARFFTIFNVKNRAIRGEHAHRKCAQFLVAMNGSVTVVVDDGKRRQQVILESRHVGLYIPPMVWATQYKYTSNAVLLVLASDLYDPADYIRSYDEFLRAVTPGIGGAVK